MNTHAIGDRGVRNVLDAYEGAGVAPADRWRVEHYQVVAPPDFARTARDGIIASIQPTFVRFAFDLPDVSAGWVSAFDVETGQSRLVSRRELRAMTSRVRSWQDDLEGRAHQAGLDVLRLDVDPDKSLPALLEFVTVRRLRK